MPRDPTPLDIPDLSAFAKRLRTELAKNGLPPGHLQRSGHLARAAGFANWQRLRTVRPAPEPLDEAKLARVLRAFAGEGRMARWPNRTAIQELCSGRGCRGAAT